MPSGILSYSEDFHIVDPTYGNDSYESGRMKIFFISTSAMYMNHFPFAIGVESRSNMTPPISLFEIIIGFTEVPSKDMTFMKRMIE